MKNVFFTALLLLMFYAVSPAQNIVNGDFEQGTSAGWSKYSKGGYGLIGTAQFFHSSEITPDVLPRSGQYMGRLGGFSYEQNSIAQNVTLPNASKVYLGLYYQSRASTTSECAGLWVGAEIRVYVAGQILYDQYLCNYSAVNEWMFAYFDISAAAGQTVEIGFRADAANSVWSFLYLDDVSILTSLTDVDGDGMSPRIFKVNQNYPNPFNPVTTISYTLPFESNVQLLVYNMLGEVVKELAYKNVSAGTHEAYLNAGGLSSGVYFYKLNATSVDAKQNFESVKKMILMK